METIWIIVDPYGEYISFHKTSEGVYKKWKYLNDNLQMLEM